MLSSFLAWLRVVVLVAVIGMPARAQQNEINASPEQTTEQQGLDPNPLRRTTLTGSPCVFPVVSEGAVQTDCFTWQGQQEMCYDGTTMVACAPLTTTTEADEETRQAWRILPGPAPPVFGRARNRREERREQQLNRLDEENRAREARFGRPLLPTNETRRAQCDPWKPPLGFNSIMEFCDHMLTVPLTTLDQTYANAYPLTKEVPTGCYVGCPVGASPQTLEAIAQPWYGKCFWPNEGVVTNVIQHPVLGDMHAFKGDVSVGNSWSVPFGGGNTQAWVIDYSNTPVRLFTGLRNFRQFRDEFRFVEPGMILGKMYARPFTERNPLPIRMFTAVFFALFEVCTESPSLEDAAVPELIRNMQATVV